MDVYGEVEVEHHSFLNSGLHRVSDQLQDPAAILRRRDLRCPLCRRLGVLQSQSGCFEGNKNVVLFPGIELRIVAYPARCPVTLCTTLFRVASCGCRWKISPHSRRGRCGCLNKWSRTARTGVVL
jgi:hypothetical protein